MLYVMSLYKLDKNMYQVLFLQHCLEVKKKRKTIGAEPRTSVIFERH